MSKKFVMCGEELNVTVKLNDVVYIPVNGEKKEVGSFDQITVQKFPKDKIKFLRNFIIEEKGKADEQIKALTQQYEPIKDLQEIDEKVVENCAKVISKGTKTFKDKMKPLNEMIMNLARKKQLKHQLEFLNKQLIEVNDDLENLEKAIK